MKTEFHVFFFSHIDMWAHSVSVSFFLFVYSNQFSCFFKKKYRPRHTQKKKQKKKIGCNLVVFTTITSVANELQWIDKCTILFLFFFYFFSFMLVGDDACNSFSFTCFPVVNFSKMHLFVVCVFYDLIILWIRAPPSMCHWQDRNVIGILANKLKSKNRTTKKKSFY